MYVHVRVAEAALLRLLGVVDLDHRVSKLRSAARLAHVGSNAGARLSQLQNGSWAQISPSPVVMIRPSNGKFHKVYGPYAYGNVTFRNVSVRLQPEHAQFRRTPRPWIEVVAAYGVQDLDLRVNVSASAGAGGCARVSEETTNAKGPWKGVRLNHTCRELY